MTDRKAIQALIDQGYHARKTGDVEAIIAIFHPAGRFELSGSKTLTAAAGTAQGHQALRTTFAGFIAAFEFIQRDVISIVIDGERAAVHSRVKMRFIPKDNTVTTDMLDLWKFENGKVVELVEFADTALVNHLMQ
jgi:ketosteroid isomerase-like protein